MIAPVDFAAPDSVDMPAALELARKEPQRFRLPDDTRAWMADCRATLQKCGCAGPVVAALTRALLLDEEARHGGR